MNRNTRSKQPLGWDLALHEPVETLTQTQITVHSLPLCRTYTALYPTDHVLHSTQRSAAQPVTTLPHGSAGWISELEQPRVESLSRAPNFFSAKQVQLRQKPGVAVAVSRAGG